MRALAAWLSFAILWLSLAGELSAPELIAAGVAGTAAAAAFEIARARPSAPRYRTSRAWLASLRPLPYEIVRDFVKLTLGALRPGAALDELREAPRPRGPGGLVAVSRSAPANELVVAVDDRSKHLRVHRLVK